MSAYKHAEHNGTSTGVHRKVWELANGPIPAGYVVHHIDHVKTNNDLANLQLMTHAEHSAHHNNKHPRIKVCEVCAETYEPAPTKRKRSRTCSWDCRNVLISILRRARAA